MARTKQTAHKSDSKGKLTTATFDESNSTSTIDQPVTSKPSQDPIDIDLTMDTQPQPTNVPGKPTVDPEATAQEQQEEVIEVVEQEAKGDTGDTASPSTSTKPSHKCS